MEKYVISNQFGDHFRYEKANRGLTEKYVYDETMKSSIDGRSIRLRVVAFPHMITGKIDRVDLNVFVEDNMVFYENHEEKVDSFTGLFSETIAMEFIQNRVNGFNIMMGTSFEI